MPFYLTRFGYTPAAWATIIKSHEDRSPVIRQLTESVGGKLVGLWYAFGDYDAYIVWEGPDNVSAAALSLTAAAGGALRSIETTVLMTVDEALSAIQRAGTLNYRPPGG